MIMEATRRKTLVCSITTLLVLTILNYNRATQVLGREKKAARQWGIMIRNPDGTWIWIGFWFSINGRSSSSIRLIFVFIIDHEGGRSQLGYQVDLYNVAQRHWSEYRIRFPWEMNRRSKNLWHPKSVYRESEVTYWNLLGSDSNLGFFKGISEYACHGEIFVVLL